MVLCTSCIHLHYVGHLNIFPLLYQLLLIQKPRFVSKPLPPCIILLDSYRLMSCLHQMNLRTAVVLRNLHVNGLLRLSKASKHLSLNPKGWYLLVSSRTNKVPLSHGGISATALVLNVEHMLNWTRPKGHTHLSPVQALRRWNEVFVVTTSHSAPAI